MFVSTVEPPNLTRNVFTVAVLANLEAFFQQTNNQQENVSLSLAMLRHVDDKALYFSKQFLPEVLLYFLILLFYHLLPNAFLPDHIPPDKLLGFSSGYLPLCRAQRADSYFHH